MDVAGSAVGVASLGIQICQGLLSYYDAWRGYNRDVDTALDTVDDLKRTLALLQSSLADDQLDESKKDQVRRGLRACEETLAKLSQKSQKLRKHGQPQGFRQNAWAELQRAWYPFRASTLAKLQELVADVRGRLSLAVQVLQLDAGITSRHLLNSVNANTESIADRTIEVQTSVAQVFTQNQQILELQRGDQYRKIVDWLSPPDPWINHASARHNHEAHTGSWFLQSDQYQEWKGGQTRHLWLYGKAGCGKTVLCSTAIEDARLYCESAANTALAAFYFSFSDSRKQSFDDLLLSLVVQLGLREPGRSMLQQEYDRPNRSLPATAALEEISIASIAQYDHVLLLLDALDECLEGEQALRKLLEGLTRLSEKAPNLKVLATSRELPDIYDGMHVLRADIVPIISYLVDIDIGAYVQTEISRDRKLRQLDSDLKKLIIETFAEKADGMFRWAYCQLRELKKLKSHKPKYVKAVLLSLPATLDATYERMLVGIEEMFREEALVLLRWLAYAQSPPSLGELAEATIINPSDGGGVDVDNRGNIEDTLDILSGLVTRDNAADSEDNSHGSDEDSNGSEEDSDGSDEDSDGSDEGSDGSKDGSISIERRAADMEPAQSDVEDADASRTSLFGRITNGTKIRLAHFSVKEYLESKRILESSAKGFYLENAREQEFLAKSCLTYLEYYSSSEDKRSSAKDLVAFPLLKYTARSWSYHSSLQQATRIDREVRLLSSETAKLDWLQVYQPDMPWARKFTEPDTVGSNVYYASMMGLAKVAEMLIEGGAQVNAQGGNYGNALQAAASEGHEHIVQMLLDNGADINAQGGFYGNALTAAALEDHEKLVQILLDNGADVNAQGGNFGNALQGAATVTGNEKIVQMLLDNGADINAQGDDYGNALQAAASEGHEHIVQMLLDNGADINARGGFYGNALTAAASQGHEKLVQILLDNGADVNAHGGYYGNALQGALAAMGNEKIVQMLLDYGADINAYGGRYGSALQAASAVLQRGQERVVQMLLDNGADVNAQGGQYGSALQAALQRHNKDVAKTLIARGA